MNEYDEYQDKIFGISETNSGVELKYYGGFWTRNFPVNFRFPQVITSMKNGEFLFYPEFIDLGNNEEKVLKSFAIEKWHYNESLTRSSITFPVNLTDKNGNLWIFKP